MSVHSSIGERICVCAAFSYVYYSMLKSLQLYITVYLTNYEASIILIWNYLLQDILHCTLNSMIKSHCISQCKSEIDKK